MKFIVTQQDIDNNPILKKKGFMVGDTCETNYFTSPTLKLKPPVQDRNITHDLYTKKDNYVEPTLEETAEVITGSEGEGVIVVPVQKEVKKSVKKAVKKK